eukprot:6760600-Prymnesium_polylepis.1
MSSHSTSYGRSSASNCQIRDEVRQIRDGAIVGMGSPIGGEPIGGWGSSSASSGGKEATRTHSAWAAQRAPTAATRHPAAATSHPTAATAHPTATNGAWRVRAWRVRGACVRGACVRGARAWPWT